VVLLEFGEVTKLKIVKATPITFFTKMQGTSLLDYEGLYKV
jgi:hypothetical protein